MPSSNFPQANLNSWRVDIKSWINTRWGDFNSISDDIVRFFEIAFEHTCCPDRAWFGVSKRSVSLVVGGIYLLGIVREASSEQGFWLLVDEDIPEIEGVEYRPVKSTKGSRFPLTWMHSESLSVIPRMIFNDLIWQSFASASERILHSRRIAADRDALQEKRNKKRLSAFWTRSRPVNLFPDEVQDEPLISEGARYQVTVNAYERDPSARKRCIDHHGTSCSVCGFSFGATYGEVAEGFIHVHHLRPLSEIGSEYTLDPLKDLIPVCPNCHAVFHLRKPAFSIEAVMELLRRR